MSAAPMTSELPESQARHSLRAAPGSAVQPEPYYQEDGITIYLGDNRTILPLLPDADLLLTDPPYGIGEGVKASRRTQAAKGDARWKSRVPTDYAPGEWDSEPVPQWMMELARAKCEWQIIFGGNYYPLPPSKCWLVWDKDNGASDFADCELAWTNLDRAVRRLRYLWNGFQKEKPEKRYHPTQKPLELMSWCLNQVPDAKTILDPWMGSGTTLVAAKERGLQAVGIEANEQYCKDAIARLAQGVLWRQNEKGQR